MYITKTRSFCRRRYNVDASARFAYILDLTYPWIAIVSCPRRLSRLISFCTFSCSDPAFDRKWVYCPNSYFDDMHVNGYKRLRFIRTTPKSALLKRTNLPYWKGNWCFTSRHVYYSCHCSVTVYQPVNSWTYWGPLSCMIIAISHEVLNGMWRALHVVMSDLNWDGVQALSITDTAVWKGIYYWW